MLSLAINKTILSIYLRITVLPRLRVSTNYKCSSRYKMGNTLTQTDALLKTAMSMGRHGYQDYTLLLMYRHGLQWKNSS